jgi:hypothetical protein
LAEEHKKSFMLYFDNFPCVAALDAEQRGELLLLLYRYAMAADKAPTDPEEVLRQHPGLREETRMAYRFLAETIRRDTEKWKEKQRRYQEAAARMGRSPGRPWNRPRPRITATSGSTCGTSLPLVGCQNRTHRVD